MGLRTWKKANELNGHVKHSNPNRKHFLSWTFFHMTFLGCRVHKYLFTVSAACLLFACLVVPTAGIQETKLSLTCEVFHRKGRFIFFVCFFGGWGLMTASWKRQSDRHKGRLYLCVVERGLEVWQWSAVTTIRGIEETGIGQWHGGTDQWSVPLGVQNTLIHPVVLANCCLDSLVVFVVINIPNMLLPFVTVLTTM